MIHTSLQKDLIEACKKGDPGAQLQVYKSYYKQMFNISYNLSGDAVIADEIVKESFMSVFGKAGTINGLTDFISRLSWLVEDKSVETWRRNNVQTSGLVTEKLLVN